MARSKKELISVEVRPISNGFIVRRTHQNAVGGYSTTEHFTDKDPLVKPRPGAVKRAAGPINRKDV